MPWTSSHFSFDAARTKPSKLPRGCSPCPPQFAAERNGAANWGGQGLHPRGNFEGFVRAASKEKWLEVHGIEHWTHFYTDYGRELQLRFFNHFLKGEGDWKSRPRVQLQVRHVDRFVERQENEWPLARTNWTRLYLHKDFQLKSGSDPDSSSAVRFEALGEGVTFLSEPLGREIEITGPLAARLTISSTTSDADLFLVFRVFTPDLREVTFMGAKIGRASC